ncbi:DUF2625 family protein [Actinokineospora sp. NBRC 105648]|uniref:DUF2625 family protein n=1 Tax=Actinokineospora sp. NBRC 105648 TaxID=3032206 RepID=UPI0024A49B05|nr:DUF2625 family protein [Actinokineospora sp. NBRC 105648]GLZ39315.1 hypothetical protein Acsp05_29390 [Actinokineospora sp. NBRC 105648]
MRPLTDLLDVLDPAWPALSAELAAGPVLVLPVDAEQGRRCLLELQVTARSTLGALALHTGGLLVLDGWLRVYGGGSELPSLTAVNGADLAVGLVVAHDVLGGVFAVNGPGSADAGRPGAPGQIVYFAPDTVAWECLDIGYSDWLSWLLTDGPAEFYRSLHWPGWQIEAAALELSQGIVVYPFPWSTQAAADMGATRRRPVPMTELLGLAENSCEQLGLPSPGFLGTL